MSQTINMSQDGYRPMKYPYTISAKIAQFPYRYYYQHSWMFKYLIFGTLITLPIFYKIQKLCKSYSLSQCLSDLSGIYYHLPLFSAFSPENVKKWDKIHREMFEGTGHH